jgi:hypothetical protein
VSGKLAFRWRLGGEHPSPFAYGESLWSGVLASFLAIDRGGSPIGIFTAYNADMRHRFVYAAAALLANAPSNRFRHGAAALEGLSLLLEYCFAGWDFRKVYLEVGEYNLPQFESVIGRFATEEGRLRSHLFLDWNWWDLVTLAVWRDVWEPSKYRMRMISGDDE